jgi:hypothetical protein
MEPEYSMENAPGFILPVIGKDRIQPALPNGLHNELGSLGTEGKAGGLKPTHTEWRSPTFPLTIRGIPR